MGAPGAPGDAASARIEERMRRSADRYRVVEFDSDDGADNSWVLLRDSDPRAAERPYLLQIHTYDVESAARTVREGSFVDPQSAQQWLEDHSSHGRVPLPAPVITEPVAQLSPIARAAVARSSGDRSPEGSDSLARGAARPAAPTAARSPEPNRR